MRGSKREVLEFRKSLIARRPIGRIEDPEEAILAHKGKGAVHKNKSSVSDKTGNIFICLNFKIFYNSNYSIQYFEYFMLVTTQVHPPL